MKSIKVILLLFFTSFVFAVKSEEAVLKGNLEWRICPADKPIKGNVNYFKDTKIYHEPKGGFYERTNPETCFSTPEEAEAKGFRKSTR